MSDNTPETQLRDEVRALPDLIKVLAIKLREGLDATIVKTCSYQGQMTWEAFVDYPTRLAYIKAIHDIAQLSDAKLSGTDSNELIQALIEGRLRASKADGDNPTD